MSHNISPSAPSSPSNASPTPNPTDFDALASMFQDIVQVLLKYGKMPDTDAEKSSQKEQLEQVEQAEESSLREQVIKFCYDTDGARTPAFSKIYANIIGEYRRGEFHDEIRCFHICASNVRKEYELLHKYNCCDFSEFLHNTYKELSIMINLLSYTDRDIDLSATELHQACYNLCDSMEKLQELHTHLENSQLVHKTMIPA